ncbi:OmpA family protein [Rhodopseudomonas palustris]|uniref:OmpA family protein n=1 Tax=Rhodopseudomonas palustris TaxID=1076 RepID=UPI0021F25017|nr:OmpA family protein [Rhodopseudomonas palustris]UYO54591.1 OmpA family protein [Rhodopseudomonas palustris]UYO54608.1 OmpA family protein [Rhodopseudomonas palustris]
MKRFVAETALASAVLLALAGGLAAQERTRIDASSGIDARSMVDTIDRTINVEPVTPQNAPAKPTPSSAPISIELKVQFGFASSDLTSQARSALNNVALALNDPKLQRLRFVVEGHTDSIGSAEDNVRLSQQRAQSVATYLQKRQVRSDRLAVMGMGKQHPLPGIAPTDERNRRVEIVPLR